ncbi:MAG: hypothetical protein WCR65_02440 [Parcubacteria group bacterium]|jgi:hypothetical protein
MAKIKKPYSKCVDLPNSKSPTYRTWHHMRERCYKKNCKKFDYYGGRGISVCKCWDKFENFYKDMGEKPKGMTLDRIDNNGNYCKENCRWATYKEQANNKSNNRIIKYNGEKKTLSQFADDFGIKQNTLLYRIKRGWNIKRALNG